MKTDPQMTARMRRYPCFIGPYGMYFNLDKSITSGTKGTNTAPAFRALNAFKAESNGPVLIPWKSFSF